MGGSGTSARGRPDLQLLGRVMGWLDWLFGGSREKHIPAAVVANAPTGRARALPYFAIIDVETTGLSPRVDRVIELAVVRVDHCGEVVDEWVTRLNRSEEQTSELQSLMRIS